MHGCNSVGCHTSQDNSLWKGTSFEPWRDLTTARIVAYDSGPYVKGGFVGEVCITPSLVGLIGSACRRCNEMPGFHCDLGPIRLVKVISYFHFRFRYGNLEA